jgi:4-amino-4-deoxy-L-arabinose transferase-like glycosyltransferase
VRNILVLLLLGTFVFIVGNNVLSLTNPDEVFYAGTAKEMAHHDTWTTPLLFGKPQFEKPILTYDLIRVGFLMFGENSFGARFFPALFALFGILAVYGLGRIGFKDDSKGMASALILMSSGLYIGLARTVFTDMIFTVFILLSLLSFFWAYEKQERKDIGLIFFHVFAALAVLTKGPLGYAIPLATVILFLTVRRDMQFIRSWSFLTGLFILLLLSLPWYLLMIQRYGDAFIKEFFYNDHWRRLLEAEHLKNDKWYFYPGSMVGCMFPWAVLTAVALWSTGKAFIQKNATTFQQFLVIWIAVVFLIFQAAHSKLVSYIFPLFPALALLAGDLWVNACCKKDARQTTILWSTWALCSLILVVLIVGPIKFPMYVSFTPVFIAMLIAQMILLLNMAYFIWRRSLNIVFMCFVIQLPLIFFGALAMQQSFQSSVSSQSAAEYLMEQGQIDGKIICSKFLARGVRYYSGKEVALMNVGGKNYFSPHPIQNLDTKESLINFLNQQNITYGVLHHHDWEDLERMAQAHGMQASLLKVIGDGYVVKVSNNGARQ